MDTEKMKKGKAKTGPADNYAWQEYGLTPAELAKAARRIKASIARERRAGALATFTGQRSDFHKPAGKRRAGRRM